MAVEYKSIEFRVHEYLVQIQDMLTLLDSDAETLSIIERNKELIKTKKYYVAVMGEFKRGKSSLINALMGLKVLPADVEPATATINRITYGSELKAIVDFKDGTKREVGISELADYVTKLTPDGASRAARIKEAIVYTPTVICQNHVDIIDTPGLNDNAEMTKITIDMLNNVDAVVVAIHARFPFGETERDFVCQLIKSENVNNIVFAVTYLDQLDEDDYIYENFIAFIKNRIYTEVLQKLKQDDEPEQILMKAEQLLSNVHIYGISSALALKFFLTNDRKALEKSRFDIFKTELMQIVTAKQAENAVKNSVRDIKSVLSGLQGQYNAKMRYFDGEISRADEYNRNIARFCDGAGKRLSAFFTAYHKDMDNAVNSLNRFKNLLVSGFIKTLSQLRSDEHSVIESAVTSASLEQYKQMNEIHLPAAKNELRSYLKKINDNYANEKKNTLTISLNQLNAADKINLDKTREEVSSFIDTAVNNIRFKWAAPIIPDTPNLSDCNIIDHIIEVVDISITRLVQELTNFVDSSRLFMYKQINHESEIIKSFSEQAENEIKNSVDIKSKAYQSNYSTFAETAKDIIKNSELILKEI